MTCGPASGPAGRCAAARSRSDAGASPGVFFVLFAGAASGRPVTGPRPKSFDEPDPRYDAPAQQHRDGQQLQPFPPSQGPEEVEEPLPHPAIVRRRLARALKVLEISQHLGGFGVGRRRFAPAGPAAARRRPTRRPVQAAATGRATSGLALGWSGGAERSDRHRQSHRCGPPGTSGRRAAGRLPSCHAVSSDVRGPEPSIGHGFPPHRLFTGFRAQESPEWSRSTQFCNCPGRAGVSNSSCVQPFCTAGCKPRERTPD